MNSSSFPKRKLKTRMEALKDFCLKENVRTVLEFGTFFGSSTAYFLEAGCHVVTVDLARYDYIFDRHSVDVIVADDRNLPIRVDVKFDLVLIDSSHEYRHTLEEIDMALRHASEWLAFDDVSWVGVQRAIMSRKIQLEMIGEDLGVYKVTHS
jgi:predicted O-methyltransferase YrrM